MELDELILLQTWAEPDDGLPPVTSQATDSAYMRGGVVRVGNNFFAGYEHPLADNGDGRRDNVVIGEVTIDDLNRPGIHEVRIDITGLILPGAGIYHPYFDNWDSKVPVKVSR